MPSANSKQQTANSNLRDNRIDIVRFIGLAMIVLAHANPPSLLFQLRNFDVPLMVLVSGISFGLSYKINQGYLSYLWRRIKRLVFPVWLFLIGYFTYLFVTNPESSNLTFRSIFLSFTLISGIGFVWIIRVFLLVATVSPLLYKYHQKIESNVKYLVSLFIALVAYEFFRYLTIPYIQSGLGKVIQLVSHYIIPFSILFALGLRLTFLSSNSLKLLSCINLFIFAVIGLFLFHFYGRAIPAQELKYPPSLYYFSYAIFITISVWQLAPSIEKSLIRIKLLSFVLFAGRNSIWVYLWHIPFTQNIQYQYFYKYPLVLIVSVALTCIQVYVVKNILSPHIKNERVRKNINILLTG